jgi:hypothetical protein
VEEVEVVLEEEEEERAAINSEICSVDIWTNSCISWTVSWKSPLGKTETRVWRNSHWKGCNEDNNEEEEVQEEEGEDLF